MANSVSRHDLKIFCGTSNAELSKKIAKYCSVDLSRANFSFYNGESDVEITDCVRGKDVYIVQSSANDTNNHLISLTFFIQACKLAGARHITAVLPLLPYTRGDTKPTDKRKPIAAKMVAVMLEAAGLNSVITMDIHSPQTGGFFKIPVDCLTAKHLFERWIRSNVVDWEMSVVVSPDDGGTRRAEALAGALNIPMAVIHRDRINMEHCITGEVVGRQIILVDDMADTGNTLNKAVQQLVDVGGASKVFILVTHAIFSRHQIPAELFQREQVVKIVVTNTVKHQFVEQEKLEVIDTSEVIGEAIRRNHYGESFTTSQLL